MEAARAICPVLGEYYRFDPTPFAEAAWREVKGVHLRRARRGRTQDRRLLVQQQVLDGCRRDHRRNGTNNAVERQMFSDAK